MKTLTTTSKALKILTSTAYIINGRLPKLDMRYNSSKDLLREIKRLRLVIDIDAIKTKKKFRASQKSEPTKTIFDNPLVRDLRANKSLVRHFNKNVVNFNNGRNHYAKSGKDIKIIEIFAKNRKS